ncbi:MAG: class I SAM-dependent methyltransferase [Chloroflexi bacterium]|nr:class I SAM-dependent methyltransferase [Chloroflexota bacterium]
MISPSSSARAAQEQFGRQAHLYAQSIAHLGGEGLEALTQYLALGSYALVLDVGTGTGFTAFAASPFTRHVLATDVTPQMLAQARRLAAERGLSNVGVMAVEAESLPFQDGSVDIVTCRQAAHHFHDLPLAVAEAWRVLKQGGAYIFTDPVAPESDAEDQWMNNVELRRDPTHFRDLRASEWREVLFRVGFTLTHTSMTKVYLEFNDWVTRAATPAKNREPLRRDFLAAKPSVAAAFGIRSDGDAIHFAWDVLVARAVKEGNHGR